ncbi:hypothetical protein R1sor_025964 [Riccia sorocarpa]|uniref:Reverse transcriptase domain-containing protein n=1 Tax=Riccia sorocarpa TaxID=122646 RepID=A0ABD3GDR8_9MARC
MAMLREAQVEGQVQGLEVGNGRQILEALFADDTGLILKADKENWDNATAVVQRFELISGARLNVAKSLVIPIGFCETPQWLIETGCKIALEGEVFTYLGCPIGVGITEEQVMQFLLDKLTKRLNHWTNKFLSWESRTILAKHILLAMPSYVMMIVGLTADGRKELTRIVRSFIWGSNREGKKKKTLVAWDTFCRSKQEGGMGFTCFELQAKALKMRFITQLMEGQDLDWVEIANAIISWKVADTQYRWPELTWTTPEVLLLGAKMRLENAPILRRMLEGWWEIRRWLNFKGTVNDLSKRTQVEQLMSIGSKWMNFKRKEVTLLNRYLKKLQISTLADWTEEKQRALQLMETSNGEMTVESGNTLCEGPCSEITLVLLELHPTGVENHSTLENIEPAGGLRWITLALQQKHIKLTCLLLFVVNSRQMWKERCEQHFRQRSGNLPAGVIIHECLTVIDEMLKSQPGEKAREEMEENRAYLMLMREKERQDAQVIRANASRLESNNRSSELLPDDEVSLDRELTASRQNLWPTPTSTEPLS